MSELYNIEQNKNYVWIIGIISFFILMLVLINNEYESVPVKFNIDCSTEIQYNNIGNNLCWGGFASQWCPMPKNIHCKIEGEMPAYEFEKL